MQADLPDPQRFKLIQRALRKYSNGAFQSLLEFAKSLNAEGLKTIEGNPISEQMADRMLGSYLPFYSGFLPDPFSGDEVPGVHEPMLTEDERRRIRLARQGKLRHMKVRDREVSAFPLRRTVLCANCGRQLTASAPRGRNKRYAYYHCATKHCLRYGRSFRQADVENGFAAMLLRIRPTYTTLSVLLQSIIENATESQECRRSEKMKLLAAQRLLRAKRATVFEMREDGSYTKEQFRERLNAIDQELDRSSASLSQMIDQIPNFDILIREGLGFVLSLMTSWAALPIALKRRFQRILFPTGIPVHDDLTFGTAQLSMIYERFEPLDARWSRLVPLTGDSWNLTMSDLLALRSIHEEWLSKEVPQIPLSPGPPDDFCRAP